MLLINSVLLLLGGAVATTSTTCVQSMVAGVLDWELRRCQMIAIATSRFCFRKLTHELALPHDLGWVLGGWTRWVICNV